MDRLISAMEANEHFADVLRDVAAGDSFTVTAHGRAIARVLPASGGEGRRGMRSLLEYMQGQPVRVSGTWTREDLYE